MEVFSVANSKSAPGLSTVGFSATSGSGLSGTDAIHATGGSGDPLSCAVVGGVGIVATGGSSTPGFGAAAIVATGGGGYNGGAGLVASGGGFNSGGAGVIGTGNSGATYSGPGVAACGGSGEFGSDGIDAFAGTGVCGCLNGLGGHFNGGRLCLR